MKYLRGRNTYQMTKLFAILLLGFASCQHLEKTHPSQQVKNDVVDSMSSPIAVNEKRYSLDEIYQKYAGEELLSYIEKTHPAWSLPNENMWYPQLFKKYKTYNSLVNYVSGDFDCDGKKDYA